MRAVLRPGPAPGYCHALKAAVAPPGADHEVQVGIVRLNLSHHPGEHRVKAPETGLMMAHRIGVLGAEHRELIPPKFIRGRDPRVDISRSLARIAGDIQSWQ